MEIFGNFRATCRHGTVFAPMQCLYCKGSYGCGEPKNAISYSVQKPHRPVRVNKLPRVLQRHIGPAMEIFEISGLSFCHGTVFATNAKFILKGSYGCGEPKMQFPSRVQKPHRPVRVNKLPRVLQRRIGQAIEIFKISGLPIDMVPCLHQCNVYMLKGSYGCGEPKNAISQSVQIPHRPVVGLTNYPVSCSAVFRGKQQKFSKFRGYLSPWYRVCTNAMFILKGSYGCGEPKNAI